MLEKAAYFFVQKLTIDKIAGKWYKVGLLLIIINICIMSKENFLSGREFNNFAARKIMIGGEEVKASLYVPEVIHSEYVSPFSLVPAPGACGMAALNLGQGEIF